MSRGRNSSVREERLLSKGDHECLCCISQRESHRFEVDFRVKQLDIPRVSLTSRQNRVRKVTVSADKREGQPDAIGVATRGVDDETCPLDGVHLLRRRLWNAVQR